MQAEREAVWRRVDQALDALQDEERRLDCALRRLDEEIWVENTRRQAAAAAAAASRYAAACLSTMTQTPYVAAVDAAVARASRR